MLCFERIVSRRFYSEPAQGRRRRIKRHEENENVAFSNVEPTGVVRLRCKCRVK